MSQDMGLATTYMKTMTQMRKMTPENYFLSVVRLNPKALPTIPMHMRTLKTFGVEDMKWKT